MAGHAGDGRKALRGVTAPERLKERKVWRRKRMKAFLAALADGLSAAGAARRAGVSYSTAYVWRERYAEFAAAWEEAIEHGTDRLEDEAIRRGRNGTLKPVFYNGNKCGHVREYSDTLLIFMLKGRRPDKYRDRHEMKLGGDITLRGVMAEIDGKTRGLPGSGGIPGELGMAPGQPLLDQRQERD